MKHAVFLDRDGTIIEHVHHLTDPSSVRLIPGVAEAIGSLRAGGYACVVVTNQSVVGRGLLSEAGLDAVHAEMTRQLATEGVELDGLYYCPVAPSVGDPLTIEHPDRKPGAGMLLRACRELGLDATGSWMIGDSISDTLAGRNAGCLGCILVRTGCGAVADSSHGSIDAVVDNLADAARFILESDRLRRSARFDKNTTHPKGVLPS